MSAEDQAARKLGSMAVISKKVQRQQAQASELPATTMLDILGGTMKLRVDAWLPKAGSKQWGLLLESITTNLSKADTQRALAAFCYGKPLVVLSTRFEEPSFSVARRVKQDVESGAFEDAAASPCFNPNEDNVNFTKESGDQKARDDRWLRVWQHMTRQANATKANGGRVIQLVDPIKGLSAMQVAEAEFADDLGVPLVQKSIELCRSNR